MARLVRASSLLLIGLVVVISAVSIVAVSTNPSDIQALEDLYYSTNGNQWYQNTTWFKGDPCTRGWFGVFCIFTNDMYYVQSLEFGGNNLAGTLPASLGDLSQLDTIKMTSNALNGTIPASLGSCTMLNYLDLRYNKLNGSIPSTLGYLTKLTTLWLLSNQLTGTIPSSLGSLTLIDYLWLQNNQLTGTIPSSLGSLTKMSQLTLNDNNLKGTIPSTFGSLKLFTFSLQNNLLSGNLSEASFLQTMPINSGTSLSGNAFSCPLPAWASRATPCFNYGGPALCCVYNNTSGYLDACTTSTCPSISGYSLVISVPVENCVLCHGRNSTRSS